MKKVLLAGEGKTELGGWAGHPAHRDTDELGVLVALLERACKSGWRIAHASHWKDIRLYRAGDHKRPEYRKVLRLLLDAKEGHFDAVVFTRDTDGDDERAAHVMSALREAPDLIAGLPAVVGGVAIRRIESWVLAFTGHAGTEAMSNDPVDRALRKLGIETTADMVASIVAGDLVAIASDARSLRAWLDSAREALG